MTVGGAARLAWVSVWSFFLFFYFYFSVSWSKMSILIEITNGQPIPFMWHLFVLLFFFRTLALENIAKILTTGPRLLLIMCPLLLFHNFLSGRSVNASECCSPVPYTIQWQFYSRFLFFHAELVHVFNNSSCIVAVSPYKPRHFTEWSRFTCA